MVVTRVGPYQRIIGFNWPASSIAAYAVTECYFRPTAGDFEGNEGDDGIEYPEAEDGYSSVWAGYCRWELLPEYLFGERYFTSFELYDETGGYIEYGTETSLGAVVTKPTLPQQLNFAPWTANAFPFNNFAYYNADFSTATPGDIDPLFPGYTVGGSLASFSVEALSGSPEKRWPGTGGRTYWVEQAAKGATSLQNSIEMADVSAMIGGRVFTAIGSQTVKLGDYGGYFVIQVLLKATT